MAPQFPSIQSFFGSMSSSPSRATENSSSLAKPGDGFTEDEVEQAMRVSTTSQWDPPGEYDEVDIGTLDAGPKAVTFMGRIVNMFYQSTPSSRPRAAKGCLKLIVKDDSGAVTVRLWFARAEYTVRFGQLVTVWATHVSHGEAGALAPMSAPFFVSIFPERDHSCHLMIHDNSDDGILCKTPIDYREGSQLPGLMPLKHFINGGDDVADVKILVCVKSIGVRKRFESKQGRPLEVVSVGVFDDTADATLSLWGLATISASFWEPSKTILLLTNAGLRTDRRPTLSLNSLTHVEVDPIITDADWLRGFALRLTKRECVNPPFPDEVFDFDAAVSSEIRILFNLADVDEFARADPNGKVVGYLSVLITELNLTSLHQRSMLMSSECCGVPIYANHPEAKCKQCDRPISLRINPRALGPVIDETGAIQTGKLIIAPPAWEQLLGISPAELVTKTPDDLSLLEQRLLFSRFTLLFGWIGDVEEEECSGFKVGRLSVAKIYP